MLFRCSYQPPAPPPHCTRAQEQSANLDINCGKLNPKKINSSPFKECIQYSHSRAEDFFKNCEYDYCAYANATNEVMKRVVCDAVEAFASYCWSKEKRSSWRTKDFCRKLNIFVNKESDVHYLVLLFLKQN